MPKPPAAPTNPAAEIPSPSRSRTTWKGGNSPPPSNSSTVPPQAAARCSSVAQMRSLEVQLGAQPVDEFLTSPTVSSSLELYIVGKIIGKGAFGKVSIGVQRMTGEQTAMKICERKKISELQAKKSLSLEVDVLKSVSRGGNPNIIQLFEVIETSTHQVLVMEYATGSALQ
eukprot:3210924-Amphidinium_carterae.1